MRRLPRFPTVAALAALAIVSIVLLWPIFGTVHGPRRMDEALSRLHSLWVATEVYAQDCGAYPDMRSAAALKAALHPEWIKDESTFVNPHDRKPICPNPLLSGLMLDRATLLPEDVVVFYGDSGRKDRPIAAVQKSGIARSYSQANWAQTAPTLGAATR